VALLWNQRTGGKTQGGTPTWLLCFSPFDRHNLVAAGSSDVWSLLGSLGLGGGVGREVYVQGSHRASFLHFMGPLPLTLYSPLGSDSLLPQRARDAVVVTGFGGFCSSSQPGALTTLVLLGTGGSVFFGFLWFLPDLGSSAALVSLSTPFLFLLNLPILDFSPVQKKAQLRSGPHLRHCTWCLAGTQRMFIE
jgi:hypothetical protein